MNNRKDKDKTARTIKIEEFILTLKLFLKEVYNFSKFLLKGVMLILIPFVIIYALLYFIKSIDCGFSGKILDMNLAALSVAIIIPFIISFNDKEAHNYRYYGHMKLNRDNEILINLKNIRRKNMGMEIMTVTIGGYHMNIKVAHPVDHCIRDIKNDPYPSGKDLGSIDLFPIDLTYKVDPFFRYDISHTNDTKEIKCIIETIKDNIDIFKDSKSKIFTLNFFVKGKENVIVYKSNSIKLDYSESDLNKIEKILKDIENNIENNKNIENLIEDFINTVNEMVNKNMK